MRKRESERMFEEEDAEKPLQILYYDDAVLNSSQGISPIQIKRMEQEKE